MANPLTERVEPSVAERRNGWTAENLAAYLAERTAQQRDYAKQQSDSKVRIARADDTHGFDPHSW